MFLSEKHKLIQKLAAKFAAKEFTKEFLDHVEESEVFPEEMYQKMAEAGFFGIKMPKDLGGAPVPIH